MSICRMITVFHRRVGLWMVTVYIFGFCTFFCHIYCMMTKDFLALLCYDYFHKPSLPFFKYLRIAGRHRLPRGIQFIPPLLSRQVLPVILCRSIKTKQIHERNPNKSVVMKTLWSPFLYAENISLVLTVWSESLLGGEGNFIALGVSCDSHVLQCTLQCTLLTNTLKNTNGNKKTSVPSSNCHEWKYQPSKIESLMVVKRSDGLMEVWLSTSCTVWCLAAARAVQSYSQNSLSYSFNRK